MVFVYELINESELVYEENPETGIVSGPGISSLKYVVKSSRDAKITKIDTAYLYNGNVLAKAIYTGETYVVPEEVKSIDEFAFELREGEDIKHLVIPSAVKSIIHPLQNDTIVDITYEGTMEEFLVLRYKDDIDMFEYLSKLRVVHCTNGDIEF